MTGQKKQTILVIEDEPLMLRVVKAALERARFNVLTARDGIEAVAVYERQKDDIALVLSDVLLPKMDGWGVYSALKAINANVQVIFTSGYFDSRLKAECEKEGIRDLIPKPFRLDDVISIIRSRISPEAIC